MTNCLRATVVVLLSCVGGATRLAAMPCDALRSVGVPHATITAAESVGAGPFLGPPPRAGAAVPVSLPGRCRVSVVLAPTSDSHIEMELWMPTENWNGKFQAVGNGGWAGVISVGSGPQAIPRMMAAALRDGYATASTDTGHRDDGTQGRFAAGHPEKLIDFAYRAVHEMTVASKVLMAAFYGASPRLSYWNGCSTGGRQGLIEAQRFPDDFDGIVAGAPANYWTHLMVGIIAVSKASHEGQPGNLPAPALKLLHDSVVAACDRLDGVADGVLQDPSRCTFDPKQLLCKESSTGACLSAAQVEAATQIYTGTIDAAGQVIYPGMARGSELGWDPVAGLQPFGIAQSHFKDVVYDGGAWDYRTSDAIRDAKAADRVDNGLITAIDPNLARFFARGGKLIQYHGWNDQQISPFNSINYFNTVQKALGDPKTLGNSYRLFMVPGMMHCGGGDGPNQFNPMAALERWREKGQTPDQILAAHVANNVVEATQPICPYPQEAVYAGTGSVRDASNYACKVP